MKLNYFWREWPQSERLLYLLFLGAFLVVSCLMLAAHFLGFHSYLDWNVLAEAEKTSILTDAIRIGPFNLTQSAENLLFYQKFDGTFPLVPSTTYYLFSGWIALALSIYIGIITTFSRFWYFIGVGLFTFFLASIKLELLLLFDSSEKIGLIVAMVLYMPLSYYFNQINTSISLQRRIVIFLLVTILYAVFLSISSTIAQPFFYLSTSLNAPATIISIVFILMVGHEIVASFVFLLFGRGESTTKNGFTHFIVITTIYLANVLIGYLHEVNIIDWNILYINVFILLLISSILGIWGFRHRENQYDFITKFKPAGAILFLLLASSCFITIAHFYHIGNDVGIEIFTDFIYYSHLAYGLLFVLYFMANFIGLIRSKLPIYKVLYKPTGMPYFTFRFAALIVVVALVLRTNWQVPVFQSTASSLNSVADYHLHNSETALAERYYLEASEYALYNHKSNYAIAAINGRNGNTIRSITRYKEALNKWPSAQAYVNLSNKYQKENRYFDALFLMKDAAKAYPKNSQVLNSLGLLYGQGNFADSAIFYFDKSAATGNSQAATSNIIATLAAQDLNISIDSVVKEYAVGSDPVSFNNTIVLSNKNRVFKDFDFTPKDSTLSTIDLALLSNNSLNALFDVDTLDTESLNKLAEYPNNLSVGEGLEYIRCLHLYKNGRVNDAFRSLNWLASTKEKVAAKYFDDIGLWALEQNAPDVASQYFRWAKERNYADANFHLAIAVSENNDSEAAKLWKTVAAESTPELQPIANKMVAILENRPDPSWDDYERYLHARYAINYTDTTYFYSIINEIEDPNYKAGAILSMATKLWNRDLINSTFEVYALLQNLTFTDPQLYESIQHFELKMLAYQENIRGLANNINQGIEFGPDQAIEKALYKALIADASNDTIAAKQNYEFIANRNPFFVESIIAAANYTNRTNPFKAYSDLLSALEINPNSIKLLKAYIYQCANVQQNTSGEFTLSKLRALLTLSEYKKVEKRYYELVKLRTEQDLD